MQRVFLMAILLCAVFSLPKGWKAVRGPSLRLLHSEAGKSVKTDPLDAHVRSALDQPFYPWGRGSQSEVFLSRDGQWVIKIPRNKKTRPHLLGRFRAEARGAKGCLESYRIAGSLLAGESAVAYVHAGGPLALPERFGLYDSLGRRLLMDPALYPFALQERKPLLAEQLAASQGEEEAKGILLALLDLIEAERAKGWVCSDYAFKLNLGYEGGRAYRIDIGSYLPVDASYSWEAIAKPVDRFLERGSKLDLLKWWREEVIRRK